MILPRGGGGEGGLAQPRKSKKKKKKKKQRCPRGKKKCKGNVTAWGEQKKIKATSRNLCAHANDYFC